VVVEDVLARARMLADLGRDDELLEDEVHGTPRLEAVRRARL